MRFIKDLCYTLSDLFDLVRFHASRNIVTLAIGLVFLTVVVTSIINRSLEAKAELEVIEGLKHAVIENDPEDDEMQPSSETRTNTSWNPTASGNSAHPQETVQESPQTFNRTFAAELKKRSSKPLSEEQSRVLAGAFSELQRFERSLLQHESEIRNREHLASRKPLIGTNNRSFDDVIFDCLAAGLISKEGKETWALVRKSRNRLLPTSVELAALDQIKRSISEAILNDRTTEEHALLAEYFARKVFERSFHAFLSDLGYQEVVDELADQSVLNNLSPEMHDHFLTRNEIKDKRIHDAYEFTPNSGIYSEETYRLWREQDRERGGFAQLEDQRFKKEVSWLKTGPDFDLVQTQIAKLKRIQSSEFSFPGSKQQDEFKASKFRPFWTPKR